MVQTEWVNSKGPYISEVLEPSLVPHRGHRLGPDLGPHIPALGAVVLGQASHPPGPACLLICFPAKPKDTGGHKRSFQSGVCGKGAMSRDGASGCS